MGKCVDSSHEGNGNPGRGIVFPAAEKLLSAVDALIDLDVGGSGPGGRALALVKRRQGELIDASAKCDAKVAILRRKLAAAEAAAKADAEAFNRAREAWGSLMEMGALNREPGIDSDLLDDYFKEAK